MALSQLLCALFVLALGAGASVGRGSAVLATGIRAGDIDSLRLGDVEGQGFYPGQQRPGLAAYERNLAAGLRALPQAPRLPLRLSGPSERTPTVGVWSLIWCVFQVSGRGQPRARSTA